MHTYNHTTGMKKELAHGKTQKPSCSAFTDRKEASCNCYLLMLLSPPQLLNQIKGWLRAFFFAYPGQISSVTMKDYFCSVIKLKKKKKALT